MSSKYKFSVEMKFTETYKKYIDEHVAIREAMCLQEMYPDILCEIQDGDGFAGRIQLSYIGFSPELGGLGYFCDRRGIEKELASNGYGDNFREKINELLEFWETENTTYKVRAAFPDSMAKALPGDDWMGTPGVAFPLYRMGGSSLDYEKLLKYGIPGMKAIIRERKTIAVTEGEATELFTAMEIAIDLLANCCVYYYEMAERLAAQEKNLQRKNELTGMAKALKNIAAKRPGSLREAIQLSWLYALISGSINYGRMDVYLGDFLAEDLAKGALDMNQAQEMINDFWKLIASKKTTYNGRVIIGGKGRRNGKNADCFAMLAMEASRVVREIEPQLTLRFYQGMNQELMEKALEVIGEGRTYPMLYNDDVNVEAVSRAFEIGLEEAEQYVPFGCGEYIIDHRSFGTPNGVINNLKALEIALRNGRDALTGGLIGVETGNFEDFKSFDQLFEAYKKQVEYFADILAKQEELVYKIAGETAAFLYLSMLYDDCIEQGKGIFSGGVRYLGGTLESYGNINTADSLTAIKNIVYDRKLMTQGQLLKALDADFSGYEGERSLLLNVPRYGNDDYEADKMAVRLHEFICSTVRNQKKKVGLHSYLIVIINNSANTIMGKWTGASADGRFSGKPMANANNPSGGSDQKGLTAMLNSLVKLSPAIHAGAVQNIKLSPELFKYSRAAVRSTLKTYFEKGGTQAMITVVSKGELEKAMVEPENYTHVFVRVGGFSARFVELDKDVQLEILSRTHY